VTDARWGAALAALAAANAVVWTCTAFGLMAAWALLIVIGALVALGLVLE